MMVASLLAVDLKACHKAGSGYQVLIGESGIYSDGKFRALSAKMPTEVVMSSLRG
jgi:hypothetical protein